MRIVQESFEKITIIHSQSSRIFVVDILTLIILIKIKRYTGITYINSNNTKVANQGVVNLIESKIIEIMDSCNVIYVFFTI